jgi:hypothetical protein
MRKKSFQNVTPTWPNNPPNSSRNFGTTATSYAMTGCLTATNVEQLTFLLFLKMADEQSRPPFSKPSPIPKGYDICRALNCRRQFLLCVEILKSQGK